MKKIGTLDQKLVTLQKKALYPQGASISRAMDIAEKAAKEIDRYIYGASFGDLIDLVEYMERHSDDLSTFMNSDEISEIIKKVKLYIYRIELLEKSKVMAVIIITGKESRTGQSYPVKVITIDADHFVRVLSEDIEELTGKPLRFYGSSFSQNIKTQIMDKISEKIKPNYFREIKSI